MTQQQILIQKAWEILEQVTPLPADCGALCSAACCRGDGETGMELLPGEEALLRETASAESFRLIPREGGTPVLVCDGRCERKLRPFACRIFPLFPFFDRKGFAGVCFDPRAFALCPLSPGRISQAFYRAVAQAAGVLSCDEEITAFLARTSAEEEEILALGMRLSGILSKDGRDRKLAAGSLNGSAADFRRRHKKI